MLTNFSSRNVSWIEWLDKARWLTLGKWSCSLDNVPKLRWGSEIADPKKLGYLRSLTFVLENGLEDTLRISMQNDQFNSESCDKLFPKKCDLYR